LHKIADELIFLFKRRVLFSDFFQHFKVCHSIYFYCFFLSGHKGIRFFIWWIWLIYWLFIINHLGLMRMLSPVMSESIFRFLIVFILSLRSILEKVLLGMLFIGNSFFHKIRLFILNYIKLLVLLVFLVLSWWIFLNYLYYPIIISVNSCNKKWIVFVLFLLKIASFISVKIRAYCTFFIFHLRFCRYWINLW
jgi:hypothetical protein